MNDFLREWVEAHPDRYELKHMSEYERNTRRLDRFRKFKRSQEEKNRKRKISSKLSFEINLDVDDDAMNRSAMKGHNKVWDTIILFDKMQSLDQFCLYSLMRTRLRNQERTRRRKLKSRKRKCYRRSSSPTFSSWDLRQKMQLDFIKAKTTGLA